MGGWCAGQDWCRWPVLQVKVSGQGRGILVATMVLQGTVVASGGELAMWWEVLVLGLVAVELVGMLHMLCGGLAGLEGDHGEDGDGESRFPVDPFLWGSCVIPSSARGSPCRAAG